MAREKYLPGKGRKLFVCIERYIYIKEEITRYKREEDIYETEAG